MQLRVNIIFGNLLLSAPIVSRSGPTCFPLGHGGPALSFREAPTVLFPSPTAQGLRVGQPSNQHRVAAFPGQSDVRRDKTASEGAMLGRSERTAQSRILDSE